MANTSISQPVAKTIAVLDLVDETLKGRHRIPEFQRPLRWQWEDVRRLFDSIVKGFLASHALDYEHVYLASIVLEEDRGISAWYGHPPRRASRWSSSARPWPMTIPWLTPECRGSGIG